MSVECGMCVCWSVSFWCCSKNDARVSIYVRGKGLVVTVQTHDKVVVPALSEASKMAAQVSFVQKLKGSL